MSYRTGTAAVAWAKHQHDIGASIWFGQCLNFVHQCFKVPAKYGTASIGYDHTRYRHKSGVPPVGTICWWKGGSHGFGHVAISAGGGYVWSNDVRQQGHIDRVKISSITTNWHQTYMGWTEDVNDVRIWTPPKAIPQHKAVVVDLSNVQEAFKRDHSRPQGKGTHEADVLIVEHALADEGLLSEKWDDDGYAGHLSVAAYVKWQLRCGYTGRDANGIPGQGSLERLGRRHHFGVHA